MAKINIIKQPKPTIIDKFLGMNLDSTGDTGLKLGESGSMSNWKITENYKLKKRNGYSQLFTDLTGDVNSMWGGKINSNDFLLFAIATKIYARGILSDTDYASLDTATYVNVDVIKTSALDTTTVGTVALDNIVVVDNLTEVALSDVDNVTSNGKYYYDSSKVLNFIVTKGAYANIASARTGLGSQNAYLPVGTCVDGTVRFFSFNDKVYMQDGTDYKYWAGSGAFADVVGYVPALYTATTPAGAGTEFEGINLLNSQKRTYFSGDGAAVDYYLPETAVDSVDKVYEDGILLTVAVDYTVVEATGIVTFGAAPANLSNNVQIYWTKDNTTRIEIENCLYNMQFGGKNDTRIFMWGNSNHKNRVYYSDLDGNGLPSAEYFPALNFNDIGSDEYAVTDVVRQYDRQIIYKQNESFYSYYDAYTDTSNVTYVVFPVFTLNQVKGNVAYDQVRLVNNNPYSIFDGIQEWIATNVRDERNAVYISKRVQPDLDLVDLTTAITVDYEKNWEYMICVGSVVWIHNYRLDVWYKYNLLDTPNFMYVYQNELYFCTDNTIMKFDDTFADNAVKFDDYWYMNYYNFGAGWLRKQINKIFFGIQPQSNSSLNVSWESDYAISNTVTRITNQGRVFSFANLHFDDFTFNTIYNPKEVMKKIKIKKFTYMKLKLYCNSLTDTATVTSLTIPVNYGGDSK